MNEYIQLYTKTSYSLLKSVIKIEEYVNCAKKNNMKSLAICDNSMYGTIIFYNKCLKEKIKPIIGLETLITYNESKYKLLLYAKNYEGLKTLFQISTKYQKNKEITYNDIDSKNLLIITPFEHGHIERLILTENEEALEIIKKYQKKFKDFYFGIDYSNKIISTKIINFLKKHNIENKQIFIHEIMALTKEETKILSYLDAIENGIIDINPIETYDCYFLENIEFDAKSTFDFADQINIIIDSKFKELPNINNKDKKSFFISLVKKGFLKRYENPEKIHFDRLKKEMDIILKMDFVNYFLVVYDLVNFSKKNNIMVGPGRGSAASSIIAYCLGITEICPIKYDLLFERFLNLERISMPDIDLDFEDNKRHLVVDYLVEKYGENHVAKIITFGTFGAKMALRDIGKILNIDKIELESILKKVSSFSSVLENYQSKDLFTIINKSKDLKNWFYIASKIEGLPRHTSIHAAGVVLSKEPLNDSYPLTYDSMYNIQFTMNELEQVGLLKIDLLGLRNLTILHDILKLVNLNINDIPLNDQKTFDLISDGDTNGIFQLESDGVKKTLRQIKPQNIDEVALTTAMYRPGPMENIPLLLKNKNNDFKFIHDDLKQILKSTYGIIVYQEQIMQIANVMAGYTLSQADLLRKGISKKNEEIIENEKKRFIFQAVEKGYNESIAKEVFNLIEKFANYGFNKAHAVSYSIIAYQLAYLKANYQKEFIASILKNSQGSLKTMEIFFKEAKKNNLSINHPSIIYSKDQICIIDEHIYLGFSQIKGVGKEASKKILETRENNDFHYLVPTIIMLLKNGVGVKQLETLNYAGCFDYYGHSKNTVFNLILELEKYKDLDIDEYIIDELKEYEYDFLMAKEKEVLGMHLNNHPVNNFKKIDDLSIEDLKNHLGNNVLIIGLVTKIYEKETKNFKKMAFIEISDESSIISVTIFPDLYEVYKPMHNEIIEIFGRIEKYQEKYQISAKNIKILSQ